ncbi:MAG: anion permease [Candidatus Riflebacteria bacterium]|nr:anion permease [Candidatus Riflebacteria bacterium]
MSLSPEPEPASGAESESESELDELLDLNRHKLSVVPGTTPTTSERWMKYLGLPAGVIAFLALYYCPTPVGLTAAGQAVIASFALALVWWVTEPVATHVTSLCLMALLVFLDGWDQARVLGVLGLDVIWLNVMAFILSSILVKTRLANRLALKLLVTFGQSSGRILLAFALLQLALAPLIPATAARTVMTLPIMLVVAAIYGSSNDNRTNFGRNLFLQNLVGINVFSSGFMTGSTANLIAVAFIASLSGEKVYYTDWMIASLPIVLVTMGLTWFFGPRLLFPLAEGETRPRISGGMEALERQLDRMGAVSFDEKKAAVVFGLVVFLWVTDRFHLAWFGFEIDAVMAAMVGAIITFLPRVGLLKWNEADIPWHLMLFSAGAYAGGMALDATGAARWAVSLVFGLFNIEKGVNFWVVYVGVIAIMMYSHLVFTSKTMRTIIMIPFFVLVAKQLGFKAMSLALPAAFTIDWVIGLPISAKPNVILFSTGQYSVLDNVRYGLAVATLGVVLFTVAGLTWFRFLGITP